MFHHLSSKPPVGRNASVHIPSDDCIRQSAMKQVLIMLAFQLQQGEQLQINPAALVQRPDRIRHILACHMGRFSCMYLRMVEQLPVRFSGCHALSARVEICIQRDSVPSGATVVAPEGRIVRLAAEIHTVFIVSAVWTSRLNFLIVECSRLDIQTAEQRCVYHVDIDISLVRH